MRGRTMPEATPGVGQQQRVLGRSVLQRELLGRSVLQRELGRSVLQRALLSRSTLQRGWSHQFMLTQ